MASLLTKNLARSTAVVTAAGAAVLAYSLVEAQSFRLRAAVVPVLPTGQSPFTILHLSDLHLTPGQHAKQEWVRGLVGLKPDVVIGTGDFIAHRDSVGPLLACLEPF